MNLGRLVSLLVLGACASFGAPAAAEERREVPDYDGRGEPPTTPGDVLLWGPRVVFAPAYVVSEYVIRRPLGFVIAGAERAGLPGLLYDLFTFGPDRQAGFFPTAYLDFGFQPSVGLYTFWDDAFLRGHDLRLRGATGGKEWLSAAFTERFHFGAARDKTFTLEASALRRPDYTFFGIGPDTRQANLMRYGMDRLRARAGFEQRFGTIGLVQSELRVESVDFRRGGYDEDPLLRDAVAGGMPAPSAYSRGYTALVTGLKVSVDQRRARVQAPAGVFAGASFENAADARAKARFVRYGGTAGGFVDLNQRGRVVSLAVTTRFADPLGGGEVPFTELVTLGGMEPMRGLYPGRLLDGSAASAELAYRWPVWLWLDGTLRTEVGNVFGEHLTGFSAGKLRWSGTLGVESTGSPDGRLEILVGAGSETFESGGRVDSLRFVIGTTHGL
jgi:hypothetical protein